MDDDRENREGRGERAAPVPVGSPAAVRVSDADRDRVAARLQHHYAVGRLTLPELEERVALVYRARTRGQLDAVTADLPAPVRAAPGRGGGVDERLLVVLLVVAPPAGVVYWLLARRGGRRRDTGER
ncbi:DUF1707 domain-containing protein [Streptomyces sp. NPDC020917]|uniref:DUF1707 domain-containing protein n=1 Tax=Streptomyces sp. NPDC020917 TaxID=3365102 RepID=UPI0037AF1945